MRGSLPGPGASNPRRRSTSEVSDSYGEHRKSALLMSWPDPRAHLSGSARIANAPSDAMLRSRFESHGRADHRWTVRTPPRLRERRRVATESAHRGHGSLLTRSAVGGSRAQRNASRGATEVAQISAVGVGQPKKTTSLRPSGTCPVGGPGAPRSLVRPRQRAWDADCLRIAREETRPWPRSPFPSTFAPSR